MRRKYINIRNLIAGTIFSAFSMVSCNSDFLNLNPITDITTEQVWTDPALSEAFILNLYTFINNGGYDGAMLSSFTDESIYNHEKLSATNESNMTPTNIGQQRMSWSDLYKVIRATNISIENLPKATFTNDALKKSLEGEARFMRAYYYNILVSYYGGVPLVSKVYTLADDFNQPRATYEEMVNFMVEDLDKAATMLDGKAMVKGRTNKLAALALKARILVHAASDLHDVPTAKAKSATIGSYGTPELIGYVSGDRKARWTAARDAAKAAWDAASSLGYKLTLASPETPMQGEANYIALYCGGYSTDGSIDKSAGSEIIFGRYFNAAGGGGGGARQNGLSNGPNGWHNWSGNQPLGQLVDDYEMMDGSKFSWTNPVHSANPYVNRDPRFYATVLFDAAPWKPRDKISGTVDPANQLQTGVYDIADGTGKVTTRNGLDTRKSSIEDWNGSRSGYDVRKFIDPDPNLVDNSDRQDIPWPIIRVTEIAFNFIEASIEAGDYVVALDLLNKIRFRAGMPALKASNAELRDRLRQEKRIEMAYEEQRFFDVRRWMIAPQKLNGAVQFIDVLGKFKPGMSMKEPYRYDPTVYKYTYTPREDNGWEARKWLDKMYFKAIEQAEINKNQGMKSQQNPGFE